MPVNPQQLQIVYYPHPTLRTRCKPVVEVDDHVRDVVARMIDLMHEANGVGLAAPQVALDWRMFVANPTGEDDNDRVYINPVLSKPATTTESKEEGCLSLPGIYGHIMRPTGITITALDLNGEEFSETSDELLARIWQHETDHLDGVLIIDKMPPMDKASNKRQIKALESEFN